MATVATSTTVLSSIHFKHTDPIKIKPLQHQHQNTRFIPLLSSNSNNHTITTKHNKSAKTPILLRKWRVLRVSAAVAQDEAAAVEEKEGGDDDDEVKSSVNTKLYFGNLPYLCDSAQLAGIIQEYANPELIEVLYDRQTGRSRGFAFVTMSTVDDCNIVIQNLEGREYGGRTMRVNFADQPKPKQPLYPETEYKLFVGNLSWSVTSESLTQLFQEHGSVVGARVLYDGETGRSRGYGFVSYASQGEMEAALETLNGVELEGRAIRVSLAEGKKQ